MTYQPAFCEFFFVLYLKLEASVAEKERFSRLFDSLQSRNGSVYSGPPHERGFDHTPYRLMNSLVQSWVLVHVSYAVYNALAYFVTGNGRQKVGVAAEKGGFDRTPSNAPLRTGLSVASSWYKSAVLWVSRLYELCPSCGIMKIQ